MLPASISLTMSKSSHPHSHRSSHPHVPVPHFDSDKRKEVEQEAAAREASREVMPSEKDQPSTSMDPDPPIRPKYGERNQNGEYEAGFKGDLTPAPAFAPPVVHETLEFGTRTPPTIRESFESELASHRLAERPIHPPTIKRGMLPHEKTQPMAARAPRTSAEGGHFGETNHNGIFGSGHPLAG